MPLSTRDVVGWVAVFEVFVTAFVAGLAGVAVAVLVQWVRSRKQTEGDNVGIGNMSPEEAAKLEAEGAPLIAQQQADFAKSQEPGEAEPYPRVYGAGEQWVDNNVDPEVTFTGTQYGYNTEAEALDRIDEARAAGKYVMFMDPDNASYVAQVGGGYVVTIED